jgi:hypothetical protein
VLCVKSKTFERTFLRSHPFVRVCLLLLLTAAPHTSVAQKQTTPQDSAPLAQRENQMLEALGGLNRYPTDSRNHRVNFQVISVDRSPVSSSLVFTSEV